MEDYETILIGKIEELISKCWNCNFCFSTCPINQSMRGFMTNGPSGITQSIYYAIKWNLFDDKVANNELLNILYSCTTCNSCVITCKEMSAGVSILDIIESGRKLLVEKMIGPPTTQKKVLESLAKFGNPYSQHPAKRMQWLKDEKVKFLPEDSAEVLLFIGCTPSFDPDLHNMARAVFNLLKVANVDFGILKNEVCCGHPALKIGDEFLFYELRSKNIDQIAESGAKKIVTISPHCFNTFTKYYQNDLQIEILHYTQFLFELLQSQKIELSKALTAKITYHDPCYLSKHSEIWDEPRKIIQHIPNVKYQEMPRNRKNSFCCGGGGGRMWLEVEEEEKMEKLRVREAKMIGADIIAVACPWCYTMLKTAIQEEKTNIEIKDIAELILNLVF